MHCYPRAGLLSPARGPAKSDGGGGRASLPPRLTPAQPGMVYDRLFSHPDMPLSHAFQARASAARAGNIFWPPAAYLSTLGSIRLASVGGVGDSARHAAVAQRGHWASQSGRQRALELHKATELRDDPLMLSLMLFEPQFEPLFDFLFDSLFDSLFEPLLGPLFEPLFEPLFDSLFDHPLFGPLFEPQFDSLSISIRLYSMILYSMHIVQTGGRRLWYRPCHTWRSTNSSTSAWLNWNPSRLAA